MNDLNSPLFKAIFETDIPRVVLKANAPDFTILAYNQAYDDSTHNHGRNLTGLSLWEAYPDNDSPVAKMLLSEGLLTVTRDKKNLKLPVFQYQIPTTEGSQKEDSWWQIEIIPVLDASGEVDLLITNNRNLTEQILSERKLNSSLKREEDLNMALAETHEELAASNEELQASVEELLSANEALSQSQGDLEFLNIELEERIALRTKDLESNRHLLENIIQTTPVAMILLRGDDLIIEHPNPHMLHIWQRSREQTVGRKITDVFPELHEQQFPALLAEVFKTGKKIAMPEVPVDISHTDGSRKLIYVNFSYDPIFDDAGKAEYILATVIDITEIVENRKLLETNRFDLQVIGEELAASNEELAATNEELAATNEELQESQENLFKNNEALSNAEESLRLALESGNLGTYSVDLSSRKFNISARAREFYGLEPDGDVYWNEITATVVPEYLPVIEQARKDAILNGLPYDVQYPIVPKSGNQIRWIRVVGKSISATEAKSGKFIGVIIDITQEVEHRSEIEESERRFRTMAEGTDVLISVGDETGDAVYFNQAWIDLTGIEMNKLLGTQWTKLIHPEDKDLFWGVYLSAFEKQIPFTGEFRILNKEGDYRWLLAKGPPRFNEDGSFEGYICSCIDITDLKRDEQRKNDFIGMVSHELKTPLTAINGFVQVLQSKAKKESNDYFLLALDKTLNQIRKMTTMINGFLNVSRLESAQLVIQKAEFNLNKLLAEMVEESDLIQYSHTITLSVKENITINADRDKIGNVISNLLSNAIKYSAAGTVVHVSCNITGNEVTVSVADQGIGISGDDAKKLFQRYYRVGSNQTISGFGIGLYLSAEIVQRHGGKIWVESTEGEGSTFLFSLPL